MEHVYDDGGRSNYFKGEAGDCVVRAIAIATESDYKQVYDAIFAMAKSKGLGSPRNGVDNRVSKAYMTKIGWKWHPTMKIGSGCRVHMREDELPSGRIICSLSKHMAAVIDGVLHDTYDCTREGTRCVYGYWSK